MPISKKDDLQKTMEERFTTEEIFKIKKYAQLEVAYLQQFKKIMLNSIEKYMKNNNATFEDVAEKLGWKKYKIHRIRKGEYNFSIPDLSYLLATLNIEPKEIFNIKN